MLHKVNCIKAGIAKVTPQGEAEAMCEILQCTEMISENEITGEWEKALDEKEYHILYTNQRAVQWQAFAEGAMLAVSAH